VFFLFQLKNTQVFFDSERILNEFGIEVNDNKFIDDNNLIFFGIELNKELDFYTAQKFIQLHDSIKKSDYISRVFSIRNDRVLINGGILPLIKKRFSFKNEKDFNNSLNSLASEKSNFISNDRKHLFVLVEAKKNLNKSEQADLVRYLQKGILLSAQKKTYVAGRIPSELYFEHKVVFEFILMTILSAILCFVFLICLTKNIKLVALTIISVIVSIVVTLGISHLFFGGIELIMIITPAIIFIVAISDLMHLTNNQAKINSDKKTYFLNRMNKIGKAIILTSITTAISFLTFLFNDIEPIIRFGFITSIGVLFTMFFALVIYAIAIDKSYNKAKSISYLNILFKNTIHFFLHAQKNRNLSFFTFLIVVFGVYATYNTKINNFLTDEINKSSDFYVQTNYFDKNFGGIKPLNIIIENEKSYFDITEYKKIIEKAGFVVDANSKENSFQNNILSNEKEGKLVFYCRTKDEGSVVTSEKLTAVNSQFNDDSIISFGGAGYLFDNVSYDLTKNLFIGLLFAIISIGLIFFFLNNYSIPYFIIAVIPNIIPIVVCLGVLFCFDFYFSLSNAFIFTIVFGLIIDDSIHLISAYINSIKKGSSKETALNVIVTQTGSAILKTTLLIILCLTPLLFSEFKSVSQLAEITMLSASIALFFDLIFLPKLIRVMIQ
jgi:predicted RND superfamily exporter protein